MPVEVVETLEDYLEGAHEAVEQRALTEAELIDILLNAPDDPQPFMENFLVIKTEDSEIVRFRLNRTQQRILAKIRELRAAGQPVRIMVLKARREGVSTLTQGLYFTLTVTNQNIEAWTLAHDRETSGLMLGMAKLFLDRLPEQITPMTSSRDKKRIVFENPDDKARKNPLTAGLGSKLYIDQAKNANAGRGARITLLHISEEAFWGNDGPTTKLALMQSVPRRANTIVIRESTANGMGDAAEFEADWTASYGNPKAKWVCLFFGWHEHDEYRMEVPSELKGEDGRLILIPDPDGEMREEDLRNGYVAQSFDTGGTVPITDEQLYWRRWCIEVNCRNSIDKFMQEYPCNPNEAFQTSGRPWFTRAGLEAISKSVCDPKAIGTFENPRPESWRDTPDKLWRTEHFDREWYRRGHMPAWVDDDTGDWWLWRLPEPGREYIVAVDTAEGGTDGDRAAIGVWAADTAEQVAEYNGYLDADLLAHQAAMACLFYNEAFCIPEVNNTGYGFIEVFKKLYGKIYFRKDPDAPIGQSSAKYRYGFKTDDITRRIITGYAQAYVREIPLNGWPQIRSRRLYNEMRTFQKDKSGTPRAIGKKSHDDLVIMFCLFLEELTRRPRRVTKETRELTLLDDKSFQEHMHRMRAGRNKTGRARYF